MNFTKLSYITLSILLVLTLVLSGCGRDKDTVTTTDTTDITGTTDTTGTTDDKTNTTNDEQKEPITYSYNSDKKIILESHDNDLDGKVDKIIAYDYDETGKLTAKRYDLNANGTDDEINYYVYGGFDLINKEELYTIDGDDLYLKSEIIYDYYPDTANISTKSEDRDLDGIYDYITTYEYDENNNLIKANHDTDGDGEIDYSKSY